MTSFFNKQTNYLIFNLFLNFFFTVHLDCQLTGLEKLYLQDYVISLTTPGSDFISDGIYQRNCTEYRKITSEKSIFRFSQLSESICDLVLFDNS